MKLDLHGVRHQEVDMLVENFVLMNQNSFPLTIVCGNSQKMIDLAVKVVNRLECKYDSYRYGVISVQGFK